MSEEYELDVAKTKLARVADFLRYHANSAGGLVSEITTSVTDGGSGIVNRYLWDGDDSGIRPSAVFDGPARFRNSDHPHEEAFVKEDDGDWVRWDDVLSLLREIAALKEEVHSLRLGLRDARADCWNLQAALDHYRGGHEALRKEADWLRHKLRAPKGK